MSHLQDKYDATSRFLHSPEDKSDSRFDVAGAIIIKSAQLASST